MNLTEFCIRKPIAAWMLMAAVTLFGIQALSRIGISTMPDADFPVVNLEYRWPGAAAIVVEQDLLQPVEDALAGIEGVKSLTSKARTGSGTITVELHLGRDADQAITDITGALQIISRTLPKDVEPPLIGKINFEDFPIMWLSVSGPFSRQALGDYARDVVRERLRRVPGVGDIQAFSPERNLRIWLRKDALEAHGLTAPEVVARLQAQHLELPAGLIENGVREIDVRLLGEAVDTASVGELVVGGTPAAPIRLCDLALVEDGFADERSLARDSGQPAEALGVKKQRGTNTVTVAQGVKKALADLQSSLPPGLDVSINYDDAVFIQKSVRDVEIELLLAIGLTALVCWLFLGSWQAMLNVLLAVPMSVLGTIAILYWGGFTLNTFTLLALALVVGIVVDDAIMVQENIARHAEAGRHPVQAARKGTREIAFAALAASAAVIAVFLPLIFIPGVLGKYLLDFGITLSVAVALSYLEAVTLAPARCAQLFRSGKATRTSLIGRLCDAWMARTTRSYAGILPWTVRHPWLVLAGAGLSIAAAIAAFTVIPKELTPPQDQDAMFVRIETQAGSSLPETAKAIATVEQWMATRAEVLRTFSIVGGFGGTGTNSAVMFVTLVPRSDRTLSQHEFEAVFRTAFASTPGLSAVVQDLGNPGGQGQISFSLRGEDFANLAEATTTAMERMRASGLFVDLDSDYQLGRSELAVEPDRDRCRDAGVDVASIAETLAVLVGGAKVGKITSGTRRIDVRARLLAADRSTPEAIAACKVRAGDGTLIPLAELLRSSERPVLQTITRRDRSRAITVSANPAPGTNQGTAMDFVTKTVRAALPPGVRLVSEGQAETFKQIGIGFGIVFLMGLLLAYMILAGQFDSLHHALTVLSVLPLAIAGAALGLGVGGFSLSIPSMLGIVLLMGIAKKNSILLVDFAARAQRGERLDLGSDTSPDLKSAASAMISAGAVRLRPILMTSVATMAAALPIALGFGAGTESRQPMAVCVFFGVLVSTAMSLVVVPALYVLMDRHTFVRWPLLMGFVLLTLAPLVWLLTL